MRTIMPISDLHASHIRRVHVEFVLEAPELEPDSVTRITGLEPSGSAKRGDGRENAKGTVVGTHEQGWWQFSSEGAVDSKDINDHLRFLLERLLPHQEWIRLAACNGETFFDVLWESTDLYAGSGPVIDPECMGGIAALGAGIGFDIYQVDDDSTESGAATKR